MAGRRSWSGKKTGEEKRRGKKTDLLRCGSCTIEFILRLRRPLSEGGSSTSNVTTNSLAAEYDFLLWKLASAPPWGSGSQWLFSPRVLYPGLAAVAAINAAIQKGVAEKTVLELMNPEAQLPQVYPFAADLYQKELATLQQQSPEVSSPNPCCLWAKREWTWI